MAVKLSIIYYSMTGTNAQMAKWAADYAAAKGAKIRLRKVHELVPRAAIDSNPPAKANADATAAIPEATGDDLEWADAILFASPTRFGVMASQLKQFLDMQGGLWAQGKLANKYVSAFASAQNSHGGQENTILSIYTVMQHWSCYIVPAGYVSDATFAAGGNPYGTSATYENGQIKDAGLIKASVEAQTDRLLTAAAK